MSNSFVQFPHPGGEPPINFIRGNICPANTTGNHFRKFLLAENGCYLAQNSNAEPKDWERKENSCFTLWGEWELPSRVTFPPNFHQSPRTIQYNGFPFQLHTPIKPSMPFSNGIKASSCGIKTTSCSATSASCATQGAKSTDPFVFCEPMLYYHCKIKRYKKLRSLNNGDIVVFGSKLNGKFVVDTVFVVNNRVSVQDQSLCGLFSQANGGYFSTDPLVYRGATFANPVNGMFSFFPALPCSDGTPQPFARPTLNLSGLINHKHGRGLRAISIQNAKQVWMDIVNQITQQGNVLGLRA